MHTSTALYTKDLNSCRLGGEIAVSENLRVVLFYYKLQMAIRSLKLNGNHAYLSSTKTLHTRNISKHFYTLIPISKIKTSINIQCNMN